MATPITELFASIGFKVNAKDIEKFDKLLDGMAGKIDKTIGKLHVLENKLGSVGIAFAKSGTQAKKFTEKVDGSANSSRNAIAAFRRFTTILSQESGKWKVAGQAAKDYANDLAAVRQQAARAEASLQAMKRGQLGNIRFGGAGGRRGPGRPPGGGPGMPGAGEQIRGFLPGFGLGWSVLQLNSVAQQMTGIQLALESVTGSEEAATQKLQELRKISEETRTPLRELAKDYTKMLSSVQNTLLEPTLDKNFGALIKYSKTLGLSGEELKGTLRALSQMTSKTQITSEELSGQLG